MSLLTFQAFQTAYLDQSLTGALSTSMDYTQSLWDGGKMMQFLLDANFGGLL